MKPDIALAWSLVVIFVVIFVGFVAFSWAIAKRDAADRQANETPEEYGA